MCYSIASLVCGSLSFVKTQDLPLSQIFPTIDSLPASGMTPRISRPDRFFWASPFYVFSFFIIPFWLVPCGRLSWLLVSFLAHVNIVHRIVSYCHFFDKHADSYVISATGRGSSIYFADKFFCILYGLSLSTGMFSRPLRRLWCNCTLKTSSMFSWSAQQVTYEVVSLVVRAWKHGNISRTLGFIWRCSTMAWTEINFRFLADQAFIHILWQAIR